MHVRTGISTTVAANNYKVMLRFQRTFGTAARTLSLSRPDYTNIHEPVSSLFTQPTTAAEWEQYALSASQVEEFNKTGFLASGVRVMSDEQVEILREELEQLYDRNHPSADLWYAFDCDVPTDDPRDNLFHSLGAWRLSPGFHDLCWSPALRMASYQLLGGPMSLLHDQLFCKPANDGGVVAWHQDFSYWTWTMPRAHLTCWIGLDDVTTESGCLWYVPGSHEWGLLPMTGLAGDMNSINDVLDSAQAEALDVTKVPAELPKGCCAFHHPLMLHGSYGNSSPNQRRATVVNMMREGVVSNCDGKDMGKFPTVPTGLPMAEHSPCYPPLLHGGSEEEALMAEAAGAARNVAAPLDLREFEKDMAELREREAATSYKHTH